MNKRTLILVLVVVSFIAAICCAGIVANHLIEQVDRTNAELQLRNDELSRAGFRAEAAERKLMRFSAHELTMNTLAARDEAVDTLLGWQGQTLMVKYDSSLVICQQIFFGGDAFEHRVWCRVWKKDGSSMDMSPTLLRLP